MYSPVAAELPEYTPVVLRVFFYGKKVYGMGWISVDSIVSFFNTLLRSSTVERGCAIDDSRYSHVPPRIAEDAG